MHSQLNKSQTPTSCRSPDHANIIGSITSAMARDYPAAFRRMFESGETEDNKNNLSLFKNRLYTKLKPFRIDSIIEGYEGYSEANPKSFPTIPGLVGEVKRQQARLNASDDREKRAAEAIAAPMPTHHVKPIEVLNEAKAGQGAKTKAELLAEQEALLRQHYREGKIRPSVTKESIHSHLCCFGSCSKPGVLSQSTSGDGKFYCQQHIRLTV